MSAPELRARRVQFRFPDDLDPVWNPRHPEAAAAANSVSLLMPYVEPYIVRSVRGARDRLDEPTRARAEEFARQELAHHAQHRRFNDLVVARHPRLARIERWARAACDWLSRTRSEEFSLAFAAGAEAIAFGIARWAEENVRTLFDGADDVVSTLFLWHLAEEVEHKSVAFDVHRAVGGSPWRYLLASCTALALLVLLTFPAIVVQLHDQRRLWSPVAWWRLTCWALGLGFEVLPAIGMSALRDHHPDQLRDPVLLSAWLQHFDPETATMPLWTSSGGAPAAGGLSPRP